MLARDDVAPDRTVTQPSASTPTRDPDRARAGRGCRDGQRGGDLDKGRQPNRGTVASALQDVTTVPGSTTAWAVGYSYDNNVAAYRTLVQRYNGTSWSIVASPNGSLWAVGYTLSGANTTFILRGTGG